MEDTYAALTVHVIKWAQRHLASEVQGVHLGCQGADQGRAENRHDPLLARG